MNSESFYKSSNANCKNNSFLYVVLHSVFDFFDLLSKKEKYRFIKFINNRLAFYVSDKTLYNKKKMAKYERQSTLQSSFMQNLDTFTNGMIYVLANFLDINICIADDKIGAFSYTIYGPAVNSHLKGSIIIIEKNSVYVSLYDNAKRNNLINQYNYNDLNRYFMLYRTQKNNTLLPYYKYKIKDLHHLAQKFNLTIKKKGRGIHNVNKSKRELYDELSQLLF